MKYNLMMLAALPKADLRAVLERDFSIAIREYAEGNGWLCEYRFRSAVKLSNGQYRGTGPAGFPDMTLVRNGRLVMAELKAERGTIRPEQQAWLTALAEVPGVSSYLWKPSDSSTVMQVLA